MNRSAEGAGKEVDSQASLSADNQQVALTIAKHADEFNGFEGCGS